MVGYKVKPKVPFVSVVMTSLNGMKWLRGFFKSVLKTNYPRFEVVFVDGGSSDGSVDFVKKNFGSDNRVKIFVAKGTGWSGGNNFGVMKAKGEILALISNDIEVDPDWLKAVVEHFQKNPDTGVVQCNVHRLDKRGEIDSGMNYLDRFGYSYGFRPVDKTAEVFFAEGMAFAFSRKVVKKIGLMDNFYFMEYDDMDYSWRARIAGFKVVFLPKAIVYHAGGGTAGASYFERRPRNVSQYARNHLITIIKNFELKNVLISFPVAFLIEISKIFYFLITRNFVFAKAAAKGILELFINFDYVLRERRKICETRTVGDREVINAMVPFMPKSLFGFLSAEKKKSRYLINELPPVIGGFKSG